MTDFARARRGMVDSQLRTSNVTDQRVLAAMGAVPRERFVPEGRRSLAYIDAPIALGVPSRSLSAPAPFARLLQLAAIQNSDTVLDLGCATGYSTAVLAALARHVVGVEPDAALANGAHATLGELGMANAEIVVGPIDGRGAPGGPFDVVIVETAVTAVPDALWSHLRDGGRLVALVGAGMDGVAHLYIRTGNDIAGRPDFNASMPTLSPPDSGFKF